jgi:hypothetical protein
MELRARALTDNPPHPLPAGNAYPDLFRTHP